MSELKRPEKYVEFESIKPKFKDLVEFYTKKSQEHRQRILEFSEYADGLEKEISILKENSKVDVLLDNVDKQLVVVPKIVAEYLKLKKGRRKLYGAFNEIANEMHSTELCNWVFQSENSQDLFARAWLDGYTVEKEKLYEVVFYVDEEDDRCLLMKTGKTISFEYESQNEGHYQQQFTEAKIKAIDERYWTFAVPVEEVEP